MSLLIETRLNALKLNESVNPRKGCLGRLEGICADFKNPTRNGRLYTKKLWENVFNDPIFKESLESKTLLGELDHPEDRLEVLAGEACIVMTDYRIDEDEGVIYAGFDILDTPRGKILKTLLDYGCVMGVSSRGQGDINNTTSGEIVDEDTYDFACFDVVTTPAVEKARQNVVESVGKTKRFVESIRKQIKEAETIGDLNAIEKVVKVTQSPEVDSLLESIQDKCKSIQEGKTITSNNVEDLPSEEEVNGKTDSVNIVDTQEEPDSAKTIREHRELLSCVNNMRKQVSAYRHRESRLLQIIESKDKQIQSLQNTKQKLKNIKVVNNDLKKENTKLYSDTKKKVLEFRESMLTQNKKVNSLENSIQTQKELIDSLTEKLKKSKQSETILQKQLNVKERNVNELKESKNVQANKITTLQEDVNNYKSQVHELNSTISDLENTISQLNEQLDILQSDITITEKQSVKESGQMELEINQYSTLVDSLHEQVKSLKAQLTESTTNKSKMMNRINSLTKQLNAYQLNYINTKARQMGVDANLVKKFVSVDTTVSQMDKIVEDLQQTKDRYAKLPFSENVPTGVTVDTSSIAKVNEEEVRLTRFVENIVNSK